MVDREQLSVAHAQMLQETPNATCPICGGMTWTPLDDVIGLWAVGLKDPVGESAPDSLPENFEDETFNMDFVRLETFGFRCDGCRFLRLHG
jgi:hypothetical protein